MKKTYLDSGILIAAAMGTEEISEKAMQILDDPEREFVSSIFLKLETMPMAIFKGNKTEVEFYELFFQNVKDWATAFSKITDDAYTEASVCGMTTVDALHVASAVSLNALELITTEKSSKPMFRTTKLKITTIN
jgi:predicted nucleic acid-binding protein